MIVLLIVSGVAFGGAAGAAPLAQMFGTLPATGLADGPWRGVVGAGLVASGVVLRLVTRRSARRSKPGR